MFASVNYSPVYAGEGEATVAVSGPMCGGCIGKLTRNAKKVEGISKRFGDVVAVSGVSFEIQRGEVVGFLGPNGAGKTTTMRLLTGFYRPDEGRVRIDGLDTQEHDLQLFTRRLKAWEVSFGDGDYHRERVARAMKI